MSTTVDILMFYMPAIFVGGVADHCLVKMARIQWSARVAEDCVFSKYFANLLKVLHIVV